MISPLDQKKKVKTYFDKDTGWQGDVYTATKGQFGEHVVKRKNYNIQMLEEFAGLKIGKALDIGCGAGVYLKELVRMGFHTVGMDYSFEMLKRSSEVMQADEQPSEVQLLAGDIEHIPLRDDSFDLVICVGVLGYLLHDEKALREMYRILKPGGHVLINISNTYQLYNLDYLFRLKIRSLFGLKPQHHVEETQPGLSITSPWHLKHSPTGYRFKSYNLWRFEKWMKVLGFRVADTMTFGFTFAIIRRYKLLPASFMDWLELSLEKFFRKFRIPYFSYSGATYIGLFKK